MQIPLFDLGTDLEMKLVWQTNDNDGNFDLADNVVSLKGNNFAISQIIAEISNNKIKRKF